MAEKKKQDPPGELADMPIQDVLDELSTSSREGLGEDEARKRIEQYGENAIEEKRKNPVLEFLSHFWGPIPWMIEAALILAGAVQKWEEFGIILLLLLVNGGVSYWHESKANQAIEALKKEMALDARVVRDGKQKTIPARKLVPGDVVVLHIGNVIPADAKLLEKQHLSADESALTGESLPVDKQESDNIYSGTPVKMGEARAVVIATGTNTRFAKTVELVAGAKEASHFQRAGRPGNQNHYFCPGTDFGRYSGRAAGRAFRHHVHWGRAAGTMEGHSNEASCHGRNGGTEGVVRRQDRHADQERIGTGKAGYSWRGRQTRPHPGGSPYCFTQWQY
jgi:hypothetical protein